MEYRDKHKIAISLQNSAYLDKDMQLLARLQPASSLLARSTKGAGSESLSFEVVFQLLEVSTKEDIIKNRNSKPAEISEVTSTSTAAARKPKKKGSQNPKNSQKSDGRNSRTQTSRKQK